MFGRDRGAVVLDRQRHFMPAARALMGKRFNMNVSLRRHGLKGVFQNAEKNLLQLAFIRPDRRQVLRELPRDFDASRLDVIGDHRESAVDDVWNANHAGVEFKGFGMIENFIEDGLNTGQLTARLLDAFHASDGQCFARRGVGECLLKLHPCFRQRPLDVLLEKRRQFPDGRLPLLAQHDLTRFERIRRIRDRGRRGGWRHARWGAHRRKHFGELFETSGGGALHIHVV